ncbi:PHD-finger domain-containing protein [Apiospora hydei]|uniref:PHD-finger domain-containing protein n=1 Tax=Apiospora hydei TaxID=1337664 RepID=A0ABR1X016_9PEZI
MSGDPSRPRQDTPWLRFQPLFSYSSVPLVIQTLTLPVRNKRRRLSFSPSPVFETPKTSQPSFEVSSSSNWTPLFAQDYPVFNATPGSLRGGAQAPFIDFSVTTPPYHQVAGHKRPLSADDLAVEIASHVNHFSPNPSLSLPPVDPARRLQSSPGPWQSDTAA